jgi:hypothetical protein
LGGNPSAGPRLSAYPGDLEAVSTVMTGREFQVGDAAQRSHRDVRSSWQGYLAPRRIGVSLRVPRGRIWPAAALLTVGLLLSAIVTLTDNQAHFATYSTTAEVGLESASALARLFAALVLFLFPWEKGGNRLQWVFLSVYPFPHMS